MEAATTPRVKVAPVQGQSPQSTPVPEQCPDAGRQKATDLLGHCHPCATVPVPLPSWHPQINRTLGVQPGARLAWGAPRQDTPSPLPRPHVAVPVPWQRSAATSTG